MLAALSCMAWPLAARGDLFDDLYRRGLERHGDLRTLTAHFTEFTTSPLLTRPLVSRGTVAVERPFRIALRYVEPEQRRVLIDGDRLLMTWPSQDIRQMRDIGAARDRIEKHFVRASPDDLRSHFTIAAKEVDDELGDYLVTMTPTRSQIREGLAKLELWIGRETLLMTAMRMTFPSGQEKRLTFTDVKVNVPIDPAIFREPGRPAAPRPR